MGRYYSEDLRRRAVLAVEDEGMSCRAAAARFGVAPSTVIGWVKTYRSTGRFAAQAQGRPRGMKVAPYSDFIRSFMQDQDHTLSQVQAHKSRDKTDKVLFLDLSICLQADINLSFVRTPHSSRALV